MTLSGYCRVVNNNVDMVYYLPYRPLMAKTGIVGVRLEPEARAALEAAAASREWTVSFTARKAIIDWLARETSHTSQPEEGTLGAGIESTERT